MSVIPEDLMRPERRRASAPRRPARNGDEADTPTQKFWLWFALTALVFCWIAEATMCAQRGF